MLAEQSARVSMGAARGFEVIPAIDLRGGRVVRLAEGDFNRETAYSTDPVGVARRFKAEGACRLHVVDLDGASAGRPMQPAAVCGICRARASPSRWPEACEGRTRWPMRSPRAPTAS